MHEEESLYLTISPRSERHFLREKSASKKLGRPISAISSGAKKIKEPFDPNAEDGDGDMKVQDNTIWERPATPKIPDVNIDKQNTNKDEYRGQHSAPDRDSGAPLHDLTTVYPEDVYSSNGRQYYSTGEDRIDRQAFELINELRGKPNALVTIYRAVPISSLKRIQELEKQARYIMKHGAIPPNVRTFASNPSEYYELISNELEQLRGKTGKDRFSINPGDWVTPFRSYAVEHGESSLGGSGKYEIVKRRVRASDLYTAGDSLAEWGYDPAEEEIPRGLSSGEKNNAQQAKKTIKESPRAYTLWEYMNEKRKRGEEISEDEEFAASQIDSLAENIVSRLVGGKIIQIAEDYEIFEALGVALELDLSNLSPELALQKAIDAFNKKFGSNHKRTSLLIGVVNAASEELDSEDFKKVIKLADKDELKRIHQSMDYSYGDMNLLTGEIIQYDGPNWLDGMTPKQIAKLVTPDTSEELLEMMLSYNFGGVEELEKYLRLKDARDRGKTLTPDETKAVEMLVNTAAIFSRNIKMDDFNPKNVQIIRDNIEKMLSKSPLFYKAVQKIGFPPIAPLNKPGFSTDKDAKNSDRTFGLHYLASNMIGIHNLLLEFVKDNEGDWQKEIPIHEMILGAKLKNGVRTEFQGNAIVDTIAHEWGHYLWMTLAKAFGMHPTELDPGLVTPKLSKEILSKLSTTERGELLRLVKLFDVGNIREITNPRTRGGGYFGSDGRKLGNFFARRNSAEIIERQRLHTLGQLFSSRIMQAIGEYKKATDAEGRKKAIDDLKNVIDEVVKSPSIFAVSPYGASMPQETFSELIKDYLSPAYSQTRQDLISQGSMDMLDRIFELIDKIGGK